MAKVLRRDESRLQIACVRWFRMQYPDKARLLFHVPNGGYRTATTAANMKKEGVVAGVSDLVLLVASEQYHGLCIEMKTLTGRTTTAQNQWAVLVKAQGYRYEVVRSFESFQVLINAYLQGV